MNDGGKDMGKGRDGTVELAENERRKSKRSRKIKKRKYKEEEKLK